MPEYEIINESTGEIETFRTGIDIKQLEDYNQWKIDQMLNPPTHSPKEYADYVESETAKLILSRVKDYISAGKDVTVLKIEEMINGKE
jgi:hypothetical protein